MPEESVTADQSRQLAKELTEGHPATVYAMTRACCKLAKGSKITSTKIKAVTNKGCEIAFVTCCGDLCEMKQGFYEIHPPLQSANDLHSRLNTIHNELCAPKIHWLVTNPLALTVLVTCSGLGFGTIVWGVEGIVDAFEQVPRLEAGIASTFGSTQTFGYAVLASWYFAVVAHGMEAAIAYRQCSKTLQLETRASLTWTTLVFLVGFPILSELQGMVQAQKENVKSK
jgi:hypothetical protein